MWPSLTMQPTLLSLATSLPQNASTQLILNEVHTNSQEWKIFSLSTPPPSETSLGFSVYGKPN
jgi:hypothetical protein